MKNRNLSFSNKLFLIFIWVIVVTGVHYLTVPINGFFESILGVGLQTSLEAPLIEEILKSLGLVILVLISSKITEWEFLKRVFSDVGEFKFLKSINWVYLIGFFSGVLFGFYENLGGYGFSGLRIVTPFLHGLETSIVAIGIYFVVKDGRKGLVKLISAYFIAVSIHSIGNSLSLAGLIIYQGVLVIVAMAVLSGISLYVLSLSD